jgi:hypothetical protein
MLNRVRRKRTVLPFVLLAILLGVNAFLIAMLLRPDPGVTAQPAAPSASEASLSPAGSTTPEATPSGTTPSPKSTPSAKAKRAAVVPTKRLFLAVSERDAWRATVGDCTTPGKVERSTDRGDTWREMFKTGIAPIVRLGMDEVGNVYTVGGNGQDCSPQYTAYSADGAVVGQTPNPLDVWYVGPKNRDTVSGPARVKAAPCKKAHVVGLTAIDTSQALLSCTNGAVMVTSDSGASWSKADQFVGAMAVGSGGGRYWIAGTDSSCDGVWVRSLTVDGSKVDRGPSLCAPSSNLSAGRVAIDVSGSAIWLWAGDRVQISTDAGRHWS